MAVSTSIKKRRILNEINELDEGISRVVNQIGLDPSVYSTAESVMENIDPWMQVPISSPSGRFTCSYRVWKSIPKEGNEDHWMYDLCSSEDGYMPVPIDESYGTSGVHDAAVKYTGAILPTIIRHDNFYTVLGTATLIYTEVGNTDFGTIEESSLSQYVREALMVHPYSGSPSVHEAIKLLLEWQWAYYNAESTEVMAIISNDFLTSLGLDVRRNGSDPVVSAFMTLPDQQVAQYFKSGTCSINEETPECPLDVKIWLIEKNVIKLDGNEIKELSNLCIKKIKAQRSYDALN